MIRRSGLPVKLAASIDVGRDKRFAFLSVPKYRHGYNYTLTMLFLTIFAHVLSCVEGSGALPSLLVLQLDSSWSENKNRYVYAFVVWLVGLGWFERVKIHYLIKGHTHDLCILDHLERSVSPR